MTAPSVKQSAALLSFYYPVNCNSHVCRLKVQTLSQVNYGPDFGKSEALRSRVRTTRNPSATQTNFSATNTQEQQTAISAKSTKATLAEDVTIQQ